MARYVPDAGDIVWLEFDPQGREQAGHRPALVLSPSAYNGKTSLMVCCPMTTRIKGYPFEVRIAGTTSSAALADPDQTTAVQAFVRIVRTEHTTGCRDAEARTVRKNYLAQEDC